MFKLSVPDLYVKRVEHFVSNLAVLLMGAEELLFYLKRKSLFCFYLSVLPIGVGVGVKWDTGYACFEDTTNLTICCVQKLILE